MNRITLASEEDVAAVRSLWGDAFGPDEENITRFQEFYRPERTFCLHDAGQIVSCLQYAPYVLHLHGRRLPIAYLMSPATAPDHQQSGAGSELLRHAMEQLRNTYAILLMPTEIPAAFYSFGFCPCYQLRRHILSAASMGTISPLWRRSGLSETDLAQYDRIYRRMTAFFDGYILRSQADWRNLLAEFQGQAGGAYLAANAYLLWRVEDGTLKIKELGFTSRAALQQAITLGRQIAAQRSASRIIWDAPLAVPAPAGALLLPHMLAISCAALQTAADAGEIAAQTKKLFGASHKLWINKII